MTLQEALGIERGEVVALVGAGGKTTTLFCLAHELWEAGGKVLATTTTKIFKPAKPHVHKLFLAQELEALAGELGKINERMIIGAGSGLDEAGKLTGLPPEWFAPLKEQRIVDWILIEADGAASRLLKVPLEHEPVVPEACTLAVWVMGVKVLGQPLNADWVHRADKAAALLGVELETPVTRDHVVRLAAHPQGCLRGVPARLRKVALINQVDSEEEAEWAVALGRSLLRHGMERAVMTSYLAGDPVKGVLRS